MLRNLIFVLFILGLSGSALAQNAVPDRRQVVTQDVDFYGSDLQALFDTTRSACQTACLGNPACKAYTFNTRSNACFPKSDVSDRQPYDGAISAVVFETDPAVLAGAEQRREDLQFLSDSDINAVANLARDIGARHPGGQWDVPFMLDSARERTAEKDYLNAMRWTGAIVAETDTADQWAEYARLSALIETTDNSQKRRYDAQAFQGAVNAYLRAPSDPARINALTLMAEALETSKRGRDMIHALRLAESIQPRQDIIASLDAAIAKYGFRITEHRADNDSASPRICADFSEPLIKTDADYTPYVRLPDADMVVQADGNQICIDGAQHGQRYTVTFREGLPAASGEKLIKDVEIALYVRDRSPSVNFPGRAYVLPKSADASLPIETVNLDEVDLQLRRVSDRNLLRAIQDDYFGKPLSEYEINAFSNEIGEDVWSGTGEVANELNQNMTTRLPLGEALADQDPGVYALTARLKGVPLYDDPGATQWFVLTDLGLISMKGADGLHMYVRGLGDAQSRGDIKLTLLSRSNRELGEAVTDADGHALFAPGMTRGAAGAAPALVIAEAASGDMAFLSLTDPAFDLSDRGVEGRAPAQPIDVFLATDRGAYRAGEVIRATVLARDAVAKAIPDLPLTAILTRPDGVEYSRVVSTEGAAGGHVFNLPISDIAPRGTWNLEIKADVDAPALASRQLLVEDFLPERIDFDLAMPDTTIRPGDSTTLTVDARYLFGAPGAGLRAEGRAKLRGLRKLNDFPGYQFGEQDIYVPSPTTYLDGGETDGDGLLTLNMDLPKAAVQDRPYQVQVSMTVQEGSGRPVERQLTRMLAPSSAMIGIKEGFDFVVAQGSDAEFQVIALGQDLTSTPMQVRWTVNRIETRYQWYQEYGSWNWEPITTRKRVSMGETALGADPLSLSASVDWGQYELLVERTDGPYVAASTKFYAGWYAPADSSSTPDTLELSLDQPDYSTGDTANLRIVPRYDGTALITVMSSHVIERQAVEVTAGENLIPLNVTEKWGAGAYVTAQVIRPMDVSAGQNPARALGLAYAKIDPGAKHLSVSIDAPELNAPRGALPTTVTVEGLTAGDTGYVTLAAVDVGILNLTGFDSPDPSDHYFGQRRLGVEIRDIYGRLIDGLNGAQGQVRSGGDAGGGLKRKSPPPTEELVAYFSGPVTIGSDGTAQISFDIPDFNGTVRLMAVAWSDTGVGSAEKDVIVRDPVVITATLPRFLAPGDTSQLLLEIIHTEGSTGRMGLDVTADGLTLAGDAPSGIDLGDGEKVVLRLPVTADEEGDHTLQVALTTPDGKLLTKGLSLGVRSNDPATSTTRRLSLAAGTTLTLDDNIFASLRAGSGTAVVSAGPLSKLNAPHLLSSLNRYPYGCTEQVTSKAMPLLYYNQVAQSLGLGNADQVEERIDQAIAQVLTRQSSNGAFGLWRVNSGDFWLDSYVADFLSRAEAKGHDVPDRAFAMAMDNLRNRINYAPDFDKGGEDIAYALMVLAREGAASMGDLRYYADVKADAFATPLAAAQLGAALASYGDQTRADRMFGEAVKRIAAQSGQEQALWRADYGTQLRDRAGVLALAVEAGSSVVNAEALTNSLTQNGPHMSTQESAWTLMATAALIDAPAANGLTLNGETVNGPFVRKFDAAGLSPQAIGNTGTLDTEITLTTVGVPLVPDPAGGYGYNIQRAYYDLDGNPASLDNVASGTRLVVVLTVAPFERGEARLMIDDPLPAGLEIDNPNLLRAGDVRSLDWINPASTRYREFRSDRFLAAVDWRSDKPFQLAYMVRAIAPGSYHHPAATVEDMYRPQYRAWTDTSAMQVTE